ncbi:hypothetical protein [Mycolicibacterium obuense]|uniref:Uncharacterized protein n=1 Tax=Mycolicibacterium obuense TaxID=1807 RepID=A0A0M2JX33_9MYCO|nr:hypothetical protein [Mycolicibacterium obuense]KKE99469.1 hypothetical protein WN67_23825 [Mycolicibacterium obuense]
MNRKVIFVPDDYWTNPPKENHMNVNPNNVSDCRRAGAFVKHHAYTDIDGMNAVISEALDAKRATEFIHAILCTYDAIVPQLVTPAGQVGMSELIFTMADKTDDPAVPEHWNRAARFLIAYGNQDNKLMTRIIHETDNVTPTIIAISDVYTIVLPALRTNFGISIIDRGINLLMAKEVENDG